MEKTSARQIDHATRRDASAGGARELTEAELNCLVGGSGDPGSGEPEADRKATPILL